MPGPRWGSSALLPSLLLSATVLLGACSTVVERRVDGFADDLGAAIRNQGDSQLVAESLPTLLLLTEGMIAGSKQPPPGLHRSAADLYGAYAQLQGEGLDAERRAQLLHKAFGHAQRAFCQPFAHLCPPEQVDFDLWQAGLRETQRAQLPLLFTLASNWLALIELESDDWNRVAQLPRVRSLLETVAAADEGYGDGAAQLYLGALATLLPPALGGQPERARVHFERAIELSAGRNLMAKVVYAERYARALFDRELHHRLLSEVLAAPLEADGLTLMNSLAKRRARALLAEENDFFL